MKHDVDNGTGAFNPILRTKLHRPQLGSDLVNRERLIKTMDRSCEVPLTLVSAPAGYGKSVLVAQWIEKLDSPIAWLSLDTDDSDLQMFLAYFLAAVNNLVPGACSATREFLQAASAPLVPVLASYLLNDLDAMDTPCAIVLDDYHRIEPLSPVQELMRRMLAHPPSRFRFIILTRHDPPLDLPNLRAGHCICDVRSQDLRFTATEIGEFWNLILDLSISDEAVRTLDREVEGWAAGLRLVALAMRHVDDPDAFFDRLHGGLPQIQEYLLHEVLGAQGDEVRDCLLASSILDRFCAEVIDAVTGPPDADHQTGLTAADFLNGLRNSNLFTVALDDRCQWFRFHHLFQELLVGELQRLHGPDHVAALHRRASQWFDDQGLIDEAIKHALAAEDIGQAIRLIARHRHAALNADQWYVLERWLSLLPTGTIRQHAELLMAHAWIVLNYHYGVEAVSPILDRVESLLVGDSGNEQVRGELALGRAYVQWLMGNGTETLRHMDVALERIPESHMDLRSEAEIAYGHANQMVGRKDQGLRYLDDLLARPDPLEEVRRTRLLAARVFIHLTDGNLLEAEIANRRLWAVVESGGSAYVHAWTSYLQGLIHLQRCEWEEAVEFLERSVEQRYLHHVRAAVDSMIGLMLAHQALGQEDEAQAALQTLNEYVAPLGDHAMESLAASAKARLAIQQGRLGTARRWLAATEPPPEGAFLWWLEIPSITRCRTMIAVGPQSGLAKAEARLRECAEVIEAQHNNFHLISVLTLLATVYARQDKTKQAIGIIERAATLARKGDLVLPFVEMGPPIVDLLHQLTGQPELTARVECLVTAVSAPRDRSTVRETEIEDARTGSREELHAVAGASLEGLTNRELDVLELLALRLRNKEIAARLNISDHTVGSHLKRIYKKLDVQGRRKAIERAVELKILDRYPPD